MKIHAISIGKSCLWLLLIVSVLLTFGCQREEPISIGEQGRSVHLSIKASYEEVESLTKTTLHNDGHVYWNRGDAISLFYGSGSGGGSKFTADIVEDNRIASFSGNVGAVTGVAESSADDLMFWGLYPYDPEASCDGQTVTVSMNAMQIGMADTFAPGTAPSLGRASGLLLSFRNIYTGLYFTVNGMGYKSVTIRSNNGEPLAGRAKVGVGNDGKPIVREVLDGIDSVKVLAPEAEGFEPGKKYYLLFYPQTLEGGFTLELKSDDQTGTFSFSRSIQFVRNDIMSAEELDTKITSWKSGGEPYGPVNEGGTESGLYFAISTFDHLLNYYPAHLISEESLEDYLALVDAMQLSTQPNTLLYYSVDEDITSMKKVQLPSNLFNVSLVTFTDGLDQGSLSKRRGLYMNDLEYLDAIHGRLENELVSGLPIKSYAIGLAGSDANSNPSLFEKNLNLIASEPQNSSEKFMYKVTNMTEVNNAFESIANQLIQSFKVQKLAIYIPFPSGHGSKIRFTLDGNTATNSNKYIEGVFDMTNYSLTNVRYVGITSSSGEIVPYSIDDGDGFVYVFEDIPVTGQEITEDKIRHWHMRPTETTWTENSEFDPQESNKIETVLKSAFIMLNIDLSRSLEGQLPTLQNNVKSFISKLYSNSVDPNYVKAVRLNTTELDLKVGKYETLQASITPATVSASHLRWASSAPSIATVDQNGKVTGVSEGTAIISVSSEDGRQLAACSVRVQFQHVESISLNETELTLFVGKTASLVATCSPSDASLKNVTWTSTVPAVATVDENGVVTPHTIGSASIVAKSVDGEKTASCAVSVTEYTPSRVPIDLSLAVRFLSQTGEAFTGYVPYEELSYAKGSDCRVIGLTVLSNSGDFIMALEDASEATMSHDAMTFYNLPTREQGVAISVKWTEINDALLQFGGDKLLQGTGYWTSTVSSSSNWFFIDGSGGSLSVSSGYKYVREVLPLERANSNSFITKTKGLHFTYCDDLGRHFAEDLNQIPHGRSVDGVAVSSSTGKGYVILALQDATASAMDWAAASSVYGSGNLPNKEQALLISARFVEINKTLNECGGSMLDYNKYYWTSSEWESSTSSDKRYYTICGNGCKVSVRYAQGNYHNVRLIKDSNGATIYNSFANFTPFETVSDALGTELLNTSESRSEMINSIRNFKTTFKAVCCTISSFDGTDSTNLFNAISAFAKAREKYLDFNTSVITIDPQDPAKRDSSVFYYSRGKNGGGRPMFASKKFSALTWDELNMGDFEYTTAEPGDVPFVGGYYPNNNPVNAFANIIDQLSREFSTMFDFVNNVIVEPTVDDLSSALYGKYKIDSWANPMKILNRDGSEYVPQALRNAENNLVAALNDYISTYNQCWNTSVARVTRETLAVDAFIKAMRNGNASTIATAKSQLVAYMDGICPTDNH